ncbi:hypothetical protein [Synechococcus sp. EJ6-Ellesmere]|uniref:hypothetical protein n=1 Tax=Synechococcus sp. EJ6-Ellesmere TaxID=2823734 RepID=UPI0020CCBDFF|nr:hypothetical protein [Synechococcus sp. EJ6-Ellesmere]MCP9824130.1 hypothetical protein [Synechococcus sp. EJ6-Ellesmere]
MRRMMRRTASRIKQKGVRVVRRILALPQTQARSLYNNLIAKTALRSSRVNGQRIARNCHNLLLKAGHPILGYKICLITEAHCLREQRRQQESPSVWGAIQLPIASQLAFFLKTQASNSLRAFTQKIKEVFPHFQLVVARKARSHGVTLAPSADVAGLFEGLSFRYIAAKEHPDGPSHCGPSAAAGSYFDRVTTESRQLLNSLAAIRRQASHRPHTPEDGQGRIGILISCFRPEPHIEGFLKNLLLLERPQRLVPIFINAGMSDTCRQQILEVLEASNFHDSIFIDKPGCGIYDAWNTGVKAVGESVSYLTNFNVDDRRHPLCLEVQADLLETFSSRQVSVTDYLYFFHPFDDIRRLYELNEGNSTLLPVTNKRTIVYRNLPHSSPMWRTRLHAGGDCGLFDEAYRSAGDADFWYRVSRAHEDAFEIAALPLSLYFNNPEGISTKPNTVGVSEHHTCSRIHYRALMQEIDNSVSPEFAERHLQETDSEHLQLYAALSAIGNP